MGWNQESMCLLPFEQNKRFPSFLSHCAGLDWSVVDMLPHFFASGLMPYQENHTWRHTNDLLIHELQLKKRSFFSKPTKKPAMLSALVAPVGLMGMSQPVDISRF